MSNKPMALTGLAFLVGVAGLMFFFIALGAIPVAREGEGLGGIGIVFALAAVACFVLAYGLFTVKPWAWPLGIGLAIGCVVLAGLSVLSRGTLAWLVLSLAPAIFLVGGLFLPDVRKALGRDGSAMEKSKTSASASKINQPHSDAQTAHKAHKTGRRK